MPKYHLDTPQRHNTATGGIDWGKPLVSIRCFAYNQEAYVKDALEGFVMQETTFPFEAIVHDDASTDGTATIIREYAEKYPHIIKPIFQTENQYSKHDGSIGRAVDSFISQHSKYIALCEGDDYWTDPLKLQKQVDWLESHPDYTGVYTNALLEDENGTLKADRFGNVKDDFDLTPELMIEGGGGVVRTVSDMHRADVMKNYPEFAKKCIVGDYPLHIYLSLKGKCRMLVEPMVVYRTVAVGSWSTGKKMRSVQQEIAIRQNFNEMLDNFDKYSDWKYHSSVVKTETYEVYDLLLKNKTHWRLISKSFPKVVANFRGMRKVDNFLVTHHLSWIYNALWNIRVWRGERAKQQTNK